MDRRCFDIAGLVGKYLTGDLTDKEREDLEEWVAATRERKEWFESITSAAYQREKLARLSGMDVKGGWGKVENVCLKRRKRGWLRWGRYAALIMLPVSACFAYLYWRGDDSGANEGNREAVIEAGSSKARLILADGKSIVLEEQQPGVLLESDGMKVNVDAERVTYENKLEGKEDNLVYHELLVPRGGEYSLTLSDGTVVFLNAESKLRFPVKFGKGLREVELEGEGFFEVARDSTAEFVVRTAGARLKVLGTVFNISAYEGDGFICATLVSGRVEVADLETGTEVVLRPNEQVLLKGGNMVVDEVDVSYATAWKEGRLRFQEKPLYEIMRIVSRWYDIEVVYVDDEVRDYAFGCNFNRHAAIEDLLKVFEETGAVDIDIQGTRVLISKKC